MTGRPPDTVYPDQPDITITRYDGRELVALDWSRSGGPFITLPPGKLYGLAEALSEQLTEIQRLLP